MVTNNQRTNRELVPGARQALDKFKNEIANELNIDYSGDKGNLTSRQNGYVGGTMVKRMIAEVENKMAGTGQSPQGQ